jgi:hypothetical protein
MALKIMLTAATIALGFLGLCAAPAGAEPGRMHRARMPPIPTGCHPQIGYNWDGIPTGFDIVVCQPSRVRQSLG